MQPLRLGIIGYGGTVHRYHLPFILSNADIEIYAFLQRSPAPDTTDGVRREGKHCTVDFPTAKHYRTIQEFCGDKEIELVLVATRPDSHAELAEKVLLAGKHGEPRHLRRAVQESRAVRTLTYPSDRRETFHRQYGASRSTHGDFQQGRQNPHRLPE